MGKKHTSPSLYSRSDLTEYYRGSLPPLFWIVSVILIIAAIAIAGAGVWSASTGKPLIAAPLLPALAQQGDFLGEHFSSILGLLTIVVLGASLLLERQASRRFALREAFLRGVDQIAKSLTTPPTIVPPFALRLVNYYARVALANPDEKELLIILNIPVTGPLRTAIENAAPKKEYPFASIALKKFREFETEMHLAAKGIERS